MKCLLCRGEMEKTTVAYTVTPDTMINRVLKAIHPFDIFNAEVQKGGASHLPSFCGFFKLSLNSQSFNFLNREILDGYIYYVFKR
jgi:hypothetical protein